jgi:hypothetical protein
MIKTIRSSFDFLWSNVKTMISSTIGDIQFKDPVLMPSQCFNEQMLNDSFTILEYIDEVTRKPYDIADVI